MRERERARVLVLGAGLAGSLLVQALARHRAPCSVELVDRHDAPNTGRRWAAFEPGPTSSAGRVLRRVRIVGPSGARTLELREHGYAVHDGDDLDRETDAALREVDGVRHVARVDGVRSDDDRGGVFASATGWAIRADWAFDSTDLVEPRAAAAWMHFLGWTVRATADAFDVGTVTLMDFRAPQRGQVRFVYVLPEDDDLALVELTAFTPQASRPPALAEDLRAYLDGELAGGWELVAEETGSVPLDPRRVRRRHGHVVDIGMRGGLLRAGTGYGYRPMTRDADRIAAALAAGRTPRGLRRHWRHAAMDAVLLRLVASDPAQVVVAFDLMFARNPIDRVAAFMNEESSLLDDARLVATLPMRPFLAAALASLLRRPVAPAQPARGDH